MIRPEALVCLGAVAAQGLLGSQVRIGRERAMDALVADLSPVAEWLRSR